MRRITVAGLCLALTLAVALVAPTPAAAERAVTPHLDQLVSVYQNLKTDPQFIALQQGLSGHLRDRAVVDRYLQFLPISPLSMLEIDMKQGRYEFKVPKLIWEWHMRWLDLHPDLAKSLYNVDQPVHELALQPSQDGATGSITAAATVGTNRNAAFNYPLPPDEYQGEIQVGVNPANPLQVVAAANTWDTQNGTCGDGIQAVFFSSDGGDTWGYTCPPLDTAYGLDCAGTYGGIVFGSDPAVVWNDNGQVVLNHMMLCYDGTDYHYAMVDTISSDGGATWAPQGIVVNSWANVNNLEDKNFYAIDNNAGSPFHGRHYSCWDRSNNEKSAFSTDNGQTWTEVDLPDTAGAASGCSAKGLASRFDLGCEMAIGKDGTVHVVYDTITCGVNSCSCEQMFYSRSTNGGQSWSNPVQVRNFNLVGFSNDSTPPAQDQRGIGPFGAIEVDNSGGACDGTLYATFGDHTGGGAATTDVWLTKSTDNGNTWSSAIKVNDDSTSNSQFHPFLKVDQSNGNPVIAWHDTRNDPSNEEVDIFAARSSDCGASVEPNIQVTNPSAEFNNSSISWSNQNSGTNTAYNPNQYGEYLGLDVLNNTAYVAWSDSRHFFPNFGSDPQQENVGFAKVDLTFTPPTATSMHVGSIVLSTQNAGKGQKTAVATVTIVDNLGNPVSSATVSGTFTGDVTGSTSAVTGGSGAATLTAGPAKIRTFGFCVDNVTHGSLTYDSGSNAQTCATF